MTGEQVKKVAAAYSQELSNLGFDPGWHREDLNYETPPLSGHCYGHLLWMCSQIESGHVTGEKAHRWLGFIQGAFWAKGRKTINEMRNENRDDAESGE